MGSGAGKTPRPSTTCAGLRRFRDSGDGFRGRRFRPSGCKSSSSAAPGTGVQVVFRLFLRRQSRIRLREHIRNIYCRARSPACGARGPAGQGATSSGAEPPYAPAASDCGKAGCVRAKSGPRLQFAGRGPFAGLPPGAKVHGMISGPGARQGVPPARRMHSTGPAAAPAGNIEPTGPAGSGRPGDRPATTGRQGDDNVGKRQQGDPGGQSGSRS